MFLYVEAFVYICTVKQNMNMRKLNAIEVSDMLLEEMKIKASGKNFLTESEFEKVHPLLEMAQISSPRDQLPRKTKVYVYGNEDVYSYKLPHFHVLIENGAIELEIRIQRSRDLTIWRTKGDRPLTWEGLTDVYKSLKRWLDQPSANFRGLTNLEVLVSTWNSNNKTQIDMHYAD